MKGPAESRPASARRDELDRIRRTYEAYEASGRDRLWSRSNPGIARCSLQAREAVVDLLSRSLPPGTPSVLDLGCGDGSLAADCQRAGIAAAWTGVDLRPRAVEQAQGAHPWATFVTAAADDLPFPAAGFDAVVATTLFSSLPSRSMEQDVAGEIARVLKPGGWLVWYDLRYGNPGNAGVHAVTRDHLAALFPAWRAELRTLTLLPPLARRLGPATALAYPALHAIPPLRSHLVGRLQRPA